MSIPTDPLRIQVIERVVDVLQDITQGATYFYTPASVSKRYTHFKEVTDGPAYSVHVDSGSTMDAGLNGWHAEDFYINIKGVVVDADDAVTAIVRSLRDVRLAIETDMSSTASGSLGSLCSALFFEECETDNGYMSLEGRGQFDQRIKVRIAGTIGTL